MSRSRVWLLSDCQSSSYDPEDPSSFEEIQAILENIIEQWEEIPEDDPVLGCVQKWSNAMWSHRMS